MVKREGECSSYMELYQKRKREEEASGPSRSNFDGQSQECMSPDRRSQRSATGSVKSLKREHSDSKRFSGIPSPSSITGAP